VDRRKMKKKCFVGTSEGMRPRGRHLLNEKIILKWILNRESGFRLHSHGLVEGSVVGCCEYGNDTSGPYKYGEFLH